MFREEGRELVGYSQAETTKKGRGKTSDDSRGEGRTEKEVKVEHKDGSGTSRAPSFPPVFACLSCALIVGVALLRSAER